MPERLAIIVDCDFEPDLFQVFGRDAETARWSLLNVVETIEVERDDEFNIPGWDLT